MLLPEVGAMHAGHSQQQQQPQQSAHSPSYLSDISSIGIPSPEGNSSVHSPGIHKCHWHCQSFIANMIHHVPGPSNSLGSPYGPDTPPPAYSPKEEPSQQQQQLQQQNPQQMALNNDPNLYSAQIQQPVSFVYVSTC